MPPARKYWLFKSEPSAFSIQDLQDSPVQTTCWDGVRNYEARNLLRDRVQVGDGVLFYHSSCKPAAAVGTARVVRAGYPDPTQFDPQSAHPDPKSDHSDPRWFAVDIQLKRIFERPVTLAYLRSLPAVKDMLLLRRGMRLSIQPVSAQEWRAILRAAGKP